MTDFTNNKNSVNLVSSEGTVFTVPIENAKISNLVKMMMDTDTDSDEIEEIPLLGVTSKILSQIVVFMEHIKEEPLNNISQPIQTNDISEIVQERYVTFLNDTDNLHELISASNYMDIKPLLTLTCVKLACMIKGKSPEEIRKTFNIVNDLTPEDEEQIREEEKWCE